MENSKKVYKEEEIEVFSLREHMRKRPNMYLSNKGITGLFSGLLFDCIKICSIDEIFFEIEILADNDFKWSISTKNDLSVFIEFFEKTDYDSFNNYFPFLLKSISEKFEVMTNEKSKIEVSFSLDTSIIDEKIDYFKLCKSMMQVALLHRQCEIITIDKRKKYISQNYFHFPEGVLYLFEKAKQEALGKPNFSLTYDEIFNGNKYQLGIAFRTDWYPSPNIISFANDIETIYGGSLVDGIIDGLVTGCKKFVRENYPETFKIKRKKFYNGLILVGAVRGQEFKYGGSFRETLDEKDIQKKVKKIVETLVFDYLSNHKEIADDFLWRFDTEHISSGMF